MKKKSVSQSTLRVVVMEETPKQHSYRENSRCYTSSFNSLEEIKDEDLLMENLS